jgi:ribosomal-protein-alanine N-acetyltransferase
VSASPDPRAHRRRGLHPIIRPLHHDDLDAVVAVEQAAYPFPWSRGIFSECLRVGYPAYGLQCAGRLCGYAIHSVGAGESHLLNLCIHPEFQRRGLGALLLEYVIGEARAAGAAVMFLEVRPSNPAAAALYRRRGFREIGRRPAYYRAADGREDAIVMELALAPGSSGG